MASISRITVYRDKKGRFIKLKKGVKGYKKFTMEVIRDNKGKILSGFIFSKKKAEEKVFTLDHVSDKWRGRLDHALSKAGIRGDKLRNAKLIEFTITGKFRGKNRRWKVSVDVAENSNPKKASQYVASRLISAIRSRGFRFAYNVETAFYRVDRVEKDRRGNITASSKAFSKKLKELYGEKIKVRIYS